MKITDLELVIENLSGSYKKFADTLEEYPILGVTYPTHYGYMKGYIGEDGHELDIFIGNGDIFGSIRVKRNEIPGGLETKFIFGVNEKEFGQIKAIFGPVTDSIEQFKLDTFLVELEPFKIT